MPNKFSLADQYQKGLFGPAHCSAVLLLGKLETPTDLPRFQRPQSAPPRSLLIEIQASYQKQT
jgi:hypothetical protein